MKLVEGSPRRDGIGLDEQLEKLNDRKNAPDVLEIGKEVADPDDSESRQVLGLIKNLIDICGK